MLAQAKTLISERPNSLKIHAQKQCIFTLMEVV